MKKQNETPKSLDQLLKETKTKKRTLLKILDKIKKAVSKDQTLIDS